MSDTAAPERGRSGCALFLGFLLIAIGGLLLAQNLFDLPLLPLFRRTLLLFMDYWPLLLVAWGVLKIYQRIVHPERASVGAFEIVLLVFLVLCGLSLSAARRVMERVSGEALEDIIGFPDAALLGAPSHRFPSEARFEIGGASELSIANPGGEV